MEIKIEKLTSKELEILLILWNFGSATVKTINEEQNKIDDVGYTSTLKIMQLMFDKGILSREPKGKGHIYSSEISEDEIQSFLLKKYTRTTSGKSAMKLVLQALGNQQESEDDLLEIRNYLNKL